MLDFLSLGVRQASPTPVFQRVNPPNKKSLTLNVSLQEEEEKKNPTYGRKKVNKLTFQATAGDIECAACVLT